METLNESAPARPLRVLFLCTGNSARSQIAEALLARDIDATAHALQVRVAKSFLIPIDREECRAALLALGSGVWHGGAHRANDGRLTRRLEEEEGDAVYDDAMTALLAGRPDPLYAFRWKEVYGHSKKRSTTVPTPRRRSKPSPSNDYDIPAHLVASWAAPSPADSRFRTRREDKRA